MYLMSISLVVVFFLLSIDLYTCQSTVFFLTLTVSNLLAQIFGGEIVKLLPKSLEASANVDRCAHVSSALGPVVVQLPSRHGDDSLNDTVC